MKNLKPLQSIQGEISITEGVVSKLGYCIVCNIDTLAVLEIRLSGLAFRICRKCFAKLKEKELIVSKMIKAIDDVKDIITNSFCVGIIVKELDVNKDAVLHLACQGIDKIKEMLIAELIDSVKPDNAERRED